MSAFATDTYTDKDLFVSTLEELRGMHHNKFEHLCGKVLRTKFGGTITVSKIGADDGVDVILEKNGDTYWKWVVQCKRYKLGNNVRNSRLCTSRSLVIPIPLDIVLGTETVS